MKSINEIILKCYLISEHKLWNNNSETISLIYPFLDDLFKPNTGHKNLLHIVTGQGKLRVLKIESISVILGFS